MSNGSGTAPTVSGTLQVVFPAKNSDNKIVINPVHIGSATTVDFINRTGGVVRLWIPKGASLFDPLPSGQDFNDLAIKDGDILALSVLNTPTYGAYPYHVFCESIDDYARGGSPPNLSCP